MVISATAKVITIRKENKSFLDEALKHAIDKEIIDRDFFDFDRPLPSFKAVKKSEARNRGWVAFKNKV
jgi:hypothetical protein